MALGLTIGLLAGFPIGRGWASGPPQDRVAEANRTPQPPALVEGVATPTPLATRDLPVAAIAPVGEPRLYRVVPGDTLSALALAAYGDEERYDWLMHANPGIRPRALQVGSLLRIPPAPPPSAVPPAIRSIP
ncbi:MAG: LysM domain-containing protein [Candidatus Sericytochromatia bacterium]|nr:LysM domain-containing protein [Candidatus Sericytochromatia bacterium]